MNNVHGIKSYFGGLGDSLQFSTLPEMFHKRGDTIHLTADAPFRNLEIKELVWSCNPFVGDPCDVAWTLGDIPGRKYINVHNDFIKNWEAIHGLLPQNSFPKIYYQPQPLQNIEGLIDTTSISATYDFSKLHSEIKNYITTHHHDLSFKFIINDHYPTSDVLGLDTIKLSNLKHYVDLLSSCKVFLSVFSGQHMLAGAVRHINSDFEQVCFIPTYGHGMSGYGNLFEDVMKTKLFILPKVKYIAL